MKYWKRGLKEMSDKTILEQWRAIAYDQQADRNKLQRFWANYFNIEKGIYEQLLSNPDEVVTGTVKELAEKYGQEVLTMVGFLDGINDSLKIPNPIETMDEDTQVTLAFDKELDKTARFIGVGVVLCRTERPQRMVGYVNTIRIHIEFRTGAGVLQIVTPVCFCHPRALDIGHPGKGGPDHGPIFLRNLFGAFPAVIQKLLEQPVDFFLCPGILAVIIVGI